ncbi:MAG: histone acetyltransferase 1 [Chrysothrix sp. TS-e1954]|nr:MAG: histone acetyltransferase 1 [Chrysothrix sp. TS-e1954]
MTDRDQSWDTSSTRSLSLGIRHASAPKRDVTFAPAFTYPIFGDEETIFGYRNLRMKLDFACDTLHPTFTSTHGSVYPATTETKADDIKELLQDFVPTAFENVPSSSSTGPPFEPPGELVEQYNVEEKQYGIWSTTLENAVARQIIKNMQIFVPFFIEGGLLLDLDLEQTWSRWTIFFTYERYTLPSHPSRTFYSFISYSTAYQLFYLDRDAPSLARSTTPTDFIAPPISTLFGHVPSRFRISQIVVLPPYQSAGHGGRLYNAMTCHARSRQGYSEITVEDPNESFDEMRNLNDLEWLYTHCPRFATLTINPDAKLPVSKSESLPIASILIPQHLLESLRRATKLHSRQFYFLLEAHLLSRIPFKSRSTARITRKDRASDPNDRAYYFWRLLVKSRLTSHNRDALSQIDPEERIEKLDETLENVQEGYVEMLEKLQRRHKRYGGTWHAVERRDEVKEWWINDPDGKVQGMLLANGDVNGANGEKAAPRKDRGAKRRIVDDEDEDDEDGDVAVMGNGTGGKKPRLST